MGARNNVQQIARVASCYMQCSNTELGVTSDKKKSPVSFWTISSDKQSLLAVDPTLREVGALLSGKKKKSP